MTTFSKECINSPRKSLTELCSKHTMEKLGYHENYLDGCIADSFSLSNLHSPNYYERDNKILRQEYDEILKYKLTSFPAIVINDKPLYGIIKEELIIINLCNNVPIKPKFCTYVTGFIGDRRKSGTTSKKVIYFLIFLLIFVNISLFIMCRAYIIEKINDKVNSGSIDIDGRINNVINNYFALKGSSNDYKAFDNKNNNSSQVIEMREGSVSAI